MRLLNKSINDYILYKLSKIDDDFTMEEALKIDELVINYNDILSNNEVFSFASLSLFKNLNKITLRFFDINEEDINFLGSFSNLKDITFESSNIRGLNNLNDINSLSLINSRYDMINSLIPLKELSITNNVVNLNDINSFNLDYLDLSYSKVFGEFKLKEIGSLCIDNTNISNFEFISNLKKLKYLKIDSNQYNENKDFFDSLGINLDICRWESKI